MPKVYAFDCDETLEVSAGPVTLQSLMELRIQGHVVGICGNINPVLRVVGWWNLISFFHLALNQPKEQYLSLLKAHICANSPGYFDDFVMVGNIKGVSGVSDDKGAAERAGWRFIKESEFAAGMR